jgi:hypothetical protein
VGITGYWIDNTSSTVVCALMMMKLVVRCLVSNNFRLLIAKAGKFIHSALFQAAKENQHIMLKTKSLMRKKNRNKDIVQLVISRYKSNQKLVKLQVN